MRTQFQTAVAGYLSRSGLDLSAAMLAIVLGAFSANSLAVPSISGCPIFPLNNYWNTRVDTLPVHPSSANWVNSIGFATNLHPDWSNNLADGFGFFVDLVPGNQPLVPITFTGNPAQTDTGPFPIPPAAVHGNNNGDREVVVVDTARCLLYEMYATPGGGGTSWTASAMAKFDLMSNALRPDGLMSADQAGLPFLPGLMRYEELANGDIAHAIRITSRSVWGLSGTTPKYIWPARHAAGIVDNPAFPPMGARFRLKPMFDISGFDPRTQIVLRAFKKYGLVLASGGGDWFLQGVSDTGWPDVVIGEIRSISGSNFEAVDTLLMQIDPNTAQSVQFGAPPDNSSIGLNGIGAIAAGFGHTCALTTAGGVKCWGRDADGELGDNSFVERHTPVDVSGLGSGVAAITATCALTTAGGVKCWGANTGDNSITTRHTPVDVVGLGSGVAAITAGESHTCALTTAGGVKCWGQNGSGQLGDNSITQRLTPVDVSGLGSGVAAIKAGAYHTCALTTAGGVKCWGNNGYGQIGGNAGADPLTPVDVSGLGSGVAAIAAGGYHTCAITTAGGVKCWGRNVDGELGDNSLTQRATPVDVSGLGSGVAAITAGGGAAWGHTCALTTAGGVKCWGRNVEGQLGDNSITQRLTPVDVSGLGSGVAAITAGSLHTCALTTAGGVKCWGNNIYGQLGDNSTVNRLTPVAVQASASVSAPGAPAIVLATPGNGQATVAFSAPASDGGSPIASYRIVCNPGSITTSGASSPITVTGLGNGLTYACSVSATNAAGTGASSNSVNVTPGTAAIPDDGFPARASVPAAWVQPASSSAPWFAASDTAYAGSFSLKSGAIGIQQRSEIYYTANFSAGSVSFARKVSSTAGVDFLQFYVDGVLQESWSGDVGWSVVRYAIPGGTHTLLWRYLKDSSGSAGADAAWIDSVAFPRLAPCQFSLQQRKCLSE